MFSIDIWEEFLDLQHYNTPLFDGQKVNSPSASNDDLKFDYERAEKEALSGQNWHNNILRIVAHLVSKGKSDAEILSLAPRFTLPGYQIHETKADIQVMIDSARQKGFERSTPIMGARVYNPLELNNHYEVHNNCYVLVETNRAKPKHSAISNFTARITREITKTDGVTEAKVFRIEGYHSDGTYFPEIEVDAKSFTSTDWVMELWGTKAEICVGTKFKDHFCAAIKRLSEPCAEKVYLHTGWVKHDGRFSYLSSSGGIGCEGLNPNMLTQLSGSMAAYDLPAPSGTPPLSVEYVLGAFAELIEDGSALLMLGGVFRSLLSEFKPCSVSLYLQGTTGTYKTATVGVLQAFFGDKFNGTCLPENWSSTANAIEKKMSLAKDALFVIDDFVARGTAYEVARLQRDAERVFRSQGNLSARGRLNQFMEVRKESIPRGMVCATGEDVPHEQSLQARLLIFSIKKGTTRLNILSELQRHAADGRLALMTAEFLCWLARLADENKVKPLINDIEIDLRGRLPEEGHARTQSNLVQVLTGIWVYMRYARDQGYIDKNIEEGFKARSLLMAKDIADHQAITDKTSSIAHRFIELLQSALSQALCHLVDPDGYKPEIPLSVGWRSMGAGEYVRFEGQGAKVGWISDECIYLDLTATQSVLKKLSGTAGNYLGSSDSAIQKALFEAGLLTDKSKNRYTKKVTLEGSRRTVLCVDRDAVLAMDGAEAVAMAGGPRSTDDDLPF